MKVGSKGKGGDKRSGGKGRGAPTSLMADDPAPREKRTGRLRTS